MAASGAGEGHLVRGVPTVPTLLQLALGGRFRYFQPPLVCLVRLICRPAEGVVPHSVVVLILFVVVAIVEYLLVALGDTFLEKASFILTILRYNLIKFHGRSVPLLAEQAPVDAGEEGILLHLRDRRALLGLLVQHAKQNALRALREVVGDLELALADILIQDVDVVVVKGWDADQHLVEHHPDLVDVARGGDAGLVKHLGGQVRRAAAERLSYHALLPRLLVTLVVRHAGLFCEAEVTQADVPFGVDHYILWLQVPVKHALGVHVLHGEDQLRRDKPRQVFLEVLVQVELLAEVAVIAQLHYHV